MAYVTLPTGKEIDIPDYCLDVFGKCENCPRCFDDCDGKNEEDNSSSPEMVEIVRCKYCGEYRKDGYCERHHFEVTADWFCADGYM